MNLSTKKSQLERLKELMDDMKPYRTDFIVKVVYGRESKLARLAARINDLKTRHGYEIASWKDKVRHNLHWYQVVKK